MFEALKHQLTAAAQAAAPLEMCGVIYDQQFIQLQNAAPDPTNNFAFFVSR